MKERPVNKTANYAVVVFAMYVDGISWLVWLQELLYTQLGTRLYILPLLHHYGSYGLLTAGLIAASLSSGRRGRAEYMRRMFRFPKKIFWYAFSIITPLALFFLAEVTAAISIRIGYGADFTFKKLGMEVYI